VKPFDATRRAGDALHHHAVALGQRVGIFLGVRVLVHDDVERRGGVVAVNAIARCRSSPLSLRLSRLAGPTPPIHEASDDAQDQDNYDNTGNGKPHRNAHPCLRPADGGYPRSAGAEELAIARPRGDHDTRDK